MTAENSAMLAKQKSALRANFVWSSRRNVVSAASNMALLTATMSS